MVYLLETTLDKHKSIFYALTKFYGINKNRSLIICKKLGFSKNFKVKNLSEYQIESLKNLIKKSHFKINDRLKKFKMLNNQRLVNIKSYRGFRKLKGFPVRGQRTRSNGNTAKKLNFYN